MFAELEALIAKWSAAYRGEWRKFAECAHLSIEDASIFFDPDQTMGARDMCNRCPVRIECLDDCLFHKDSWCVRGGCDDDQRVKIYLHQKRYHTAFRADIDRALER